MGISNEKIIELTVEGAFTPEEAIEKSKRLGLDHREIAKFFDLKLPEQVDESKMPKVARVTARGVPFELPDGREIPFLYVGQKPWKRGGEGSTHELTARQLAQVEDPSNRKRLFIMEKVALPEKPEPDKKSAPAASPSRQALSNKK